MNRSYILSLLGSGLVFVLAACTSRTQPAGEVAGLPIEEAILKDTSGFFYVDFRTYPSPANALPIGFFDAGTGGLTVLNALVELDEHINTTHEKEKDGVLDFAHEQFVYLADQANMPYGHYYTAGKSDLLIEHILKDGQFLLSHKYYRDVHSVHAQTDKAPVKLIVIACNTATAYGKEDLEALIRKTGVEIKVVGVIDAGARGALEIFSKNESGSIGVLATVGTIASKGYERTLLKLKESLHYTGDIQVFNQGGHGLAEMVDGEPEFIDRMAKAPRKNYKGPSLDHSQYAIDKTLWDIYHFDFKNNAMLCDTQHADDCGILQLNSPENYIRFHVVSMLEQMRLTPKAQPLKALLLGCTHYPYLKNEINKVLNELYQYQENGQYRYRAVMDERIELIDPAQNVAREVYSYLVEKNLFNSQGSIDSSEFYITVPNLTNAHIVTDSLDRFTYDYKYGRNAGDVQEYVKIVPFSKDNVPEETLKRLGVMVPATYSLIAGFDHHNPKTSFLPTRLKIDFYVKP